MSEQTADDQNVDSEEAAEAPADNVRPMDRAKKRVAAKVDDAREKFQQVRATAGERFQQASATAQERTQEARQRARERFEATSAQMQDGYARAQDGYARVRKDVDYMVDDVNDFVRHKPGTAILIAAGAGFLLGLLFRPRRYDD